MLHSRNTIFKIQTYIKEETGTNIKAPRESNALHLMFYWFITI